MQAPRLAVLFGSHQGLCSLCATASPSIQKCLLQLHLKKSPIVSRLNFS